MLRTYQWRGVFWSFEDGHAPEGAVLVEAVAPVTPETPEKAPTPKRASRARKPKAEGKTEE